MRKDFRDAVNTAIADGSWTGGEFVYDYVFDFPRNAAPGTFGYGCQVTFKLVINLPEIGSGASQMAVGDVSGAPW